VLSCLHDVGRTIRYIATDNPVTAKRVGRELLLAGDSLVMFRRRRPRTSGRHARIGGHAPPTSSSNRVSGADVVTILRVWHACPGPLRLDLAASYGVPEGRFVSFGRCRPRRWWGLTDSRIRGGRAVFLAEERAALGYFFYRLTPTRGL
jgi:plasmid stabilization system protein ParE